MVIRAKFVNVFLSGRFSRRDAGCALFCQLKKALSCALFCAFIPSVLFGCADQTNTNVAANLAVIEQCNVDNTLRFTAPGSEWEAHSLPIGNGYMGATVLGGVVTDKLNIAEKTLWTGGPGSREGYDFGWPQDSQEYQQVYREVTNTILHERAMSPEDVAAKLGRDPTGYGSYQAMLDIDVTFSHDDQVEQYQRELDMATGLVTVSYQQQQTRYQREFFANYPSQVIASRYAAKGEKRLFATVTPLLPDNRSVNYRWQQGNLIISGNLHDNQLAYEVQIAAAHEGGVLTPTDRGWEIEDAQSLTLFVVSATNYANSFPEYRTQHPHEALTARLNAAVNKGYDELRAEHVADHSSLFSRVALCLDDSPEIDTATLLNGVIDDSATPAMQRQLTQLYYQFGRYLLIASSRKGTLPANLQGVWNNYTQAPWSADYHVNINLQMNYWLADMTNLSEAGMPLFDFVEGLRVPAEQTAQRLFDAPGWTLLLNTNIWGYTGLISWPTAFWQPEANAWLAAHFYQHYLYTLDETFLRERAWPVMWGAAEFWQHVLVTDPNTGQLVVAPSYSPEHGDFSVGAAMSQQIVGALLRDTHKVARQLGMDQQAEALAATLSQLASGLNIGQHGQLQEWQADIDDMSSQHRHISHLYALHPDQDISPERTPALAAAAKRTLEARGDGGTGWSKAWKINFWARLYDGDRANKLLIEQLRHSTLPNLWDNHPPFQIDGNFGATAGITEMLLQSQPGELQLLPALPRAWAKGHISGIKAMGNITVSMTWQDGLLAQATMYSPRSQQVTITLPQEAERYEIADGTGNRIVVTQQGRRVTLTISAEQSYRIQLKDKV